MKLEDLERLKELAGLKLDEGKVKNSIMHDAENMSKEEFEKKHGKKMADEYFESIEEDVEQGEALTEMFDKPYPFKLVYKSDESVEFITKLPDKTTLRIVFTSKNQPDGQWELFFKRGDRIDLSGKGDQQRIFATVLKAIAEFVEKKSPNKIVFTADKDGESTSRMKLYDRLVSRFASDIGYSSKAQTVTGENWAERSYTLTRKMNEGVSTLTEEQFDEAAGKKDACYHKVKSRYKVWPSAYASGALVKCRKVGAKNWGNKSK